MKMILENTETLRNNISDVEDILLKNIGELKKLKSTNTVLIKNGQTELLKSILDF